MTKRRLPDTAPRKAPKQARSSDLVDAILQAAIRVLERDGAQRFTTTRVAETAGVSVGSLYQYFPNKHAILFRLQLDEWARTGEMVHALIRDRARTIAVRLRGTMRAFFRSECDEAPLRLALAEAAPVFRDAPEAKSQRRRAFEVIAAFVAEAAPRATPRQRSFAGELLFTTMTTIGKDVSERGLERSEVDAWADATADMLLGYLRALRPARSASA